MWTSPQSAIIRKGRRAGPVHTVFVNRVGRARNGATAPSLHNGSESVQYRIEGRHNQRYGSSFKDHEQSR